MDVVKFKLKHYVICLSVFLFFIVYQYEPKRKIDIMYTLNHFQEYHLLQRLYWLKKIPPMLSHKICLSFNLICMDNINI